MSCSPSLREASPMPMLTAKFTVDVSSPCLLQWPDDGAPSIDTTFGRFHVTVRMISAKHWRSKHQSEANWTTGLHSLEINVSGEEPTEPPPVVVTLDGRHDLTVQGEYLRTRLPEYQAVALAITNRVLQFFQFSLFTPLVRAVPRWNEALHNPTWFGADGVKLRAGTGTAVAQPIPGIRGELSARKLTPTDLPALRSFLANPIDPSLAETLLSDAQSAWFENSLRRSVLELAICAEVLVKRQFFAEASPA